MPDNRLRVTAQHIHGLAASVTMQGNRSILATTDDGLRYVEPGQVFTEGSGIHRILLTSSDLIDGAQAAGISMSAYLKANAAQIAAELNALLTEES